MIISSFNVRDLLFAGSLATLLIISPAFAQQAGEQPASPPAAPEAPKPDVSKPMPIQQPQPTTVPGRPDIPNAEVAKQLRNVAPLPLGAPEDKLPVSQLKLPKGFKVEVYASGIGLLEIDVKVDWQLRGREQSVAVSTMVYNRGQGS